MTRPRIAIAGFQHETNTFAPIPTTFADFEMPGAWPGMTTGSDVIDVFADLNIPIGGFISAAKDWDIVPLLWTNAEPGGYVAQSAFDRIAAMICDGIRTAGTLDGLYLDLHGAMVTEDFEDGEGELLRRVRKFTGPDLPIAVSLDLHGNVTPEMAERASTLAIYRTYPHIDMAETGARAKALLQAELARGRPFARAYRQLDYIIPIQAQSTMREPGHRLYAMLADLEAGRITSCDLALGFPPADIEHCGVSLIAYAEEQTNADAAADRLLSALNAAEDDFHNPLIPAHECVAQAISIASGTAKPVVIADPQDNPGAGATGDTTGLLEALVQGKARKAVLGILWDPETAARAHAAGQDAEIDVAIGGRYPQLGCQPCKVRVRVENLSGGIFTATGPMYGGATANLGPCALLHILDANSDVRVVVGSVRTQNADQACFTHIGINPAEQNIVAVKSAVHFLADYEPIAETVLFADAPGANPCQLDTIPFTRLRPGVRLGPHGPAFKR
jgi:microcystin degradation protein MlrC